MLIDVHQHVWTEPFVVALERRSTLPFIRRERGLVTLYLAGEAPCLLDLSGESPAARRALVSADGMDRALVCISSPLGAEALPRPEADLLLDAYHAGALALGTDFGVWGAIALNLIDPDDVDDVRERGCIGLSLPAGALADPECVSEIAPALGRAHELDFPVLVHPGPAPWTTVRDSSLSHPLWWPALTQYVAEMSAAWLTFVTVLRREYPELRIVFTMLAGGGPLLAERLEVRSGRPWALDCDPRLFYETSSFGPQAVDAVARVVGPRQLLYGSDRPVIDPPRGDWRLQLAGNAQWLLEPLEVAA